MERLLIFFYLVHHRPNPFQLKEEVLISPCAFVEKRPFSSADPTGGVAEGSHQLHFVERHPDAGRPTFPASSLALGQPFCLSHPTITMAWASLGRLLPFQSLPFTASNDTTHQPHMWAPRSWMQPTSTTLIYSRAQPLHLLYQRW